MGRGSWVTLELGGDSGFSCGDWFFVPEPELVRVDRKRPFAQKPDPNPKRPAVLVLTSNGPAATVWPRSGSWEGEGILHDRHPVDGVHPQCKVREPGKVCNHVPCTVRTARLEEWYECKEPDGSPLWDDLYAEPDR